MRSHTLGAALAGALLVLAGACGPGRTAAATQTTPAAFDATKSDAKAIELVDATIAACGGDAAWLKAKELHFTVALMDGANTVIDATHVWDRWNGRHQFTVRSPDKGPVAVTTYEIFGDVAFATSDKNDVPFSTVKEWLPQAKERLALDSYALFMVFKLKDPGVTLKYDGERADKETPETPSYDVIKVTFDAGVGPAADTYHVVIRKSDHLIAWVEWTPAGKPDDYRIAYRWDDWQDVGGMKLAMKRVNIGHEAEVIQFSDVAIKDSVDEDLFVKAVR